MSLADNILRRRQELEGAFRPRYNPMESVVSALSDIEKAAFERQGEEAKRKYETERQAREAEKFGLEKTETEARTKQLQAQTERDREERIALANQREARRQEFLARAAAQREEAKRKAQEESARRVAQQVHGYLQQQGLTTKDIFETKPLDKELRGVVEARGGETAATKTGTARDDITKMADVAGMSPEELMMRVQELETGAEGERQKLGLIGEKAKTEQARQRELDRRRRAAAGAPSEAQKTKEADEAYLRTLKKKFEELKIKEKELRVGAESGFTLTPEVLRSVQQARIAAREAQSGINALRALMSKYKDIESYTGPLDNMEAWIAQKFGAQSQAQAEIRSTINRVFQAFKLIQTGAAAGNKEMQDLKDIMPATTDMLPAILGKMSAADNLVNEKVGYYDTLLSTRDIRSGDQYAAGGTAAPAAPKTPPSAAVTDAAAAAGVELE